MSMMEVPVGPHRLMLVAELARLTPAYLFDCWTKQTCSVSGGPRRHSLNPGLMVATTFPGPL
jgi:hypothetical protein